MRLDVLGADRELVRLQRDDARLDVEVAAELLPHHVHVAAEDEVRPVRRLAGGLAPPRHFHFSDSAPSMIASDEPWVRVPVVSPGAWYRSASMRMQRCSISAVCGYSRGRCSCGAGSRDDPLRLGLHPRRHEGGQVAPRDAVEDELLAQQAHGVDRGHADVRQLMVGRVAEQEGVAVAVAVGVDGFVGGAHPSIKPQPSSQLITRRG
jgi:hypothetical protein